MPEVELEQDLRGCEIYRVTQRDSPEEVHQLKVVVQDGKAMPELISAKSLGDRVLLEGMLEAVVRETDSAREVEMPTREQVENAGSAAELLTGTVDAALGELQEDN